MNTDRLSYLDSSERTTRNGGGDSELNNNSGVGGVVLLRLSLQECCAICKALKHFDKMHELVKPLETLTEKMFQKCQDNAFSMKDASVIMQGLVQHGLMTLECGMSDLEYSNKELTPQHEGDHIEHQTKCTLHKDSPSLAECNSHNGDNDDGEISSSNDGARLNYRYSGTQPSQCRERVDTITHNRNLKGPASIHSDLSPFQRSECGKTLKQNPETHMLTRSNIKLDESKVHARAFTQKCDLINADIRQLVCNKCGKSTRKRQMLATAM
ncbi:zinc finger protein 134-like isoform X2 [Ptychodera flava]|uniref:zinc finger protein 134-like isoform X2 n=1 Tax=Ptychodera flava TaxID=63121 RepID=UPI00396A2F39